MLAMQILLFLMRHSIVLVGAVFLLLMVTTYWPGRRARFERDAHIPLRDDT
jgi:cbb3-type cytochrome oxidase subunit 3